METRIFLTVSLLFILFSFTACMKDEGNVTTKVVNVELNVNEPYSYNIPPSGEKDVIMDLSEPASHSSKCTITTVNSNYTLFEYTPDLNYSGNDEVIIHNTVNRKSGNSHHGNCNSKHGQNEINYIFKFNIVNHHP